MKVNVIWFRRFTYPVSLKLIRQKLSERRDSESIEFARKEMKRYLLKKRTAGKRYHPIILENISDGDVVLDVGCGTASRSIWLVRSKRVYNIGVDIDKSSLILAKAEIKEGSLGIIELIVADANFLPLKRDSVSLTIFNAALHHLPYTWKEILEETYQLLKEGGKLIVKEPCSMNPMYAAGTRILRSRFGLFFAASKREQYLARYDEGQIAFKPDELKQRLEEAGFSIERERFLDFIGMPLRRAAEKSRQPYSLVFKLLTYFTKPLDYIMERIPVIQKYCSIIIVVCKKSNSQSLGNARVRKADEPFGESDLEIEPIKFKEVFYCKRCDLIDSYTRTCGARARPDSR